MKRSIVMLNQNALKQKNTFEITCIVVFPGSRIHVQDTAKCAVENRDLDIKLTEHQQLDAMSHFLPYLHFYCFLVATICYHRIRSL